MEFSNIQPVSQSGHLQEQASVNGADELCSIFNNQANAGDQIEIFLAIAEGQSETAPIHFSTLVKKSNQDPIKALALRGLSETSQPYKQVLASCESLASQELLQLLCSEIRNRSSELIAWAAAEALREMGFSLENIYHPQGGNLSEPPRRIQNEILDRKIQEIDRIQRLNSRGQFTAEYERFLNFWVYGPTVQFFEESLASQNYIDIADDILHMTQIRGIQLALNASNKKVQELALNKAGFLFRQYLEADQVEFRNTLGNKLKRFLRGDSSSDSALEKVAKALTCEQLDMELDHLNLSEFTIVQLNQQLNRLEEYSSSLSSIFSEAIHLVEHSALINFLTRKKLILLDCMDNRIEIVQKQVRAIQPEKEKLKKNYAVLMQSMRDSQLTVSQNSKLLNLSIDCQTWKDCVKLNSLLTESQQELLSKLEKAIADLETRIEEVEGTPDVWRKFPSGNIGCALGFFLVAAFHFFLIPVIFIIYVYSLLEKRSQEEKISYLRDKETKFSEAKYTLIGGWQL